MDCQKCGLCCRKLILKIGCHDIVREPRLAAVAKPFRDTEGPCGSIVGGAYDGLPIHEYPCHLLTTVDGCPMLGPDNLCTIYPTRPNVCVGFPVGGTQCRALRAAAEETGS